MAEDLQSFLDQQREGVIGRVGEGVYTLCDAFAVHEWGVQVFRGII